MPHQAWQAKNLGLLATLLLGLAGSVIAVVAAVLLTGVAEGLTGWKAERSANRRGQRGPRWVALCGGTRLSRFGRMPPRVHGATVKPAFPKGRRICDSQISALSRGVP